MSQYDDTNRGALFKNEQKSTEQQPDYKGTLNVGGSEFYVSSWIKTSKAGQKYMSLSLKAKDEQPPAPKAKAARFVEDDGEDLPF